MTTAPPGHPGAGSCHVTNQQRPSPATRPPRTITPMTDTPAHKTSAVDAGVFVAALILVFVSIANGWTLLAWLSGAVVIGVMVTTAARRQLARGDEQPRDGSRPWRRGAE